MRKPSSKVSGDINPWFRSKVTFTMTEFTKMDSLRLAKNYSLLIRTNYYLIGLSFTEMDSHLLTI